MSLFWVFRPSRCRLASVRYLVRVWGFTSIPFSFSFSTISCVSKPRFFIRSSVGARVKMACFTVMARFPSSVTVAGLSLANSCRISFTWLAVMLIVISPVDDGVAPRFCLLPLAVKRHACPLVYAVNPSCTWRANGITGTADAAKIMTAENGFLSGDYKLPGDGVMSGTFNDGGATKDTWSLGGGSTVAFQRTAGSGEMHITYSGDYDRLQDTPNKGSIPGRDNPDTTRERIYIDEVTEDLLVIISGKGIFNIDTTWGDMPKVTATLPEGSDANLSVLSIETQARAQRALPRVDQAMINTNSIRAHLGSMQNRLENTVTNLEIQAENLQASESRISDADAAGEMTEFAHSQILTRTATAMLAQANSLPGLLAGLLNG